MTQARPTGDDWNDDTDPGFRSPVPACWTCIPGDMLRDDNDEEWLVVATNTEKVTLAGGDSRVRTVWRSNEDFSFVLKCDEATGDSA